MSSTEAADLAYLTEVCKATDVSLYDLLFEILEKVQEQNPNNVANNVALFPKFAYTHKKEAFRPLPPKIKKEYRRSIEQDSRTLSRAQANKKSLQKTLSSTSAASTSKKKKKVPWQYRSLVLESHIWSQIGIGLPNQDPYLMDQWIAQFVAKKKLTDVRFIGVIFGLEGNYYIIESAHWYPDPDHKNYEEKNTMPAPPRKGVAVDVQPEPPGKGINRCSYWVCSYSSGPWTLLPDVTPQQINAARCIKKYFSGNLDREIISYPSFPGKEINYLRAQIARITAATTVSPTGAFAVHEPDDDEDDEPEYDNEEDEQNQPPKEFKTRPLVDLQAGWTAEWEAEGTKVMNNTEQWVHHYPHIMKIGRVTKIPEKEEDPDAEEEEPDEDEQEPEEPEEEKELLLPIMKDKRYNKFKMPVEKDENEEEEEADEPDQPDDDQQNDPEEEDSDAESEEGAEEDPSVVRIPAWQCRMVHSLSSAHSIVYVKSNRWPGAHAYVGQKGKVFGTIYMGNGLKKTCRAFAPTPAQEIQKEAADVVEVEDPLAAHEKLLLRGDELPEKDSEDEADDDADEEQEDEEN
eukprot:TRINITY_DN32393_c0_g1_i1.p1 TRINITY_DN32393_c0_g1~~TRINITY_DN32393_c0_g1_i1.p1  ORF type:complete len:583 (+),score=91.53 TRINITY_DN32393_c0_g1_i1:31-1749(+)